MSAGTLAKSPTTTSSARMRRRDGGSGGDDRRSRVERPSRRGARDSDSAWSGSSASVDARAGELAGARRASRRRARGARARSAAGRGEPESSESVASSRSVRGEPVRRVEHRVRRPEALAQRRARPARARRRARACATLAPMPRSSAERWCRPIASAERPSRLPSSAPRSGRMTGFRPNASTVSRSQTRVAGREVRAGEDGDAVRGRAAWLAVRRPRRARRARATAASVALLEPAVVVGAWTLTTAGVELAVELARRARRCRRP